MAAGLVRQAGTNRFAAANPTDVSGKLLKRWEDRLQGAQLDLLRMRGQLAELALIHATQQRTLHGPPLERIESPAEVDRILDLAVGECSVEVLSAQPGGPRPAQELKGAHERDRDLLQRGVRLRTLYQHSARFDPPTVRYAAEMAELGGEVRTVTSGLPRCLVLDRTLLVVPLQDAPGGALIVRSPDLVDFAAETFEVLWTGGEVINKAREKVFIQDIADQTKRSILQHLLQGEDDRATARALGISVRTCQRHVSDMMRRLGATSRLQLGYLVDRHGLLDAETPDSERAGAVVIAPGATPPTRSHRRSGEPT
ncbi:helix-turn-helix transcriptional regulator [Streptomyces sp. CB00455]|uniref:helix-turn-helix transcriptional regulator n=1 Tax=Streptomyces sp. CB00455 TaxID=1703927 RepID=UPI00093FEF9E|nr:helix-turn-helix transcriptional regulator [Streptomyces sp. CB00455]